MLETLIYFAVTVIAIAIPLKYILDQSQKQKLVESRYQSTLKRGLTEPVSLHPVINVNRCIQTGACVSACPEGEILGIIDGKAELVSPTRCIGHGACEAACPVEAISLVFGSERRGVELPYIKPTFETNVNGVYIAGELGGMGLIRNAVTQGKQAIDHISSSLPGRPTHGYDIAIVGAGPAGLAASLQAKSLGLNAITLEQDEFGGAILSYPRQKLVMTQPMEIPLYGQIKTREIVKEDLLSLWTDVVEKTGLAINCHEKVDSIVPENGGFVVNTSRDSYQSRRVLLAIGRRGTPRKLGIPGERSTKVAYRLLEPENYRSKHVLVVGGGDSAVEAALALAEQPRTTVTLSYRKNQFSRLKEKNETRILTAITDKRICMLYESQVEEIRREDVTITHAEQLITIRNDFVFILIGGVVPTKFLKDTGISMVKKYGER